MRIDDLQQFNRILDSYCHAREAKAVYHEKIYHDLSSITGDYLRIHDIKKNAEGVTCFFSTPGDEYEFDDATGFAKVKGTDPQGRVFEETINIRQEIPPLRKIYCKPMSLVVSL